MGHGSTHDGGRLHSGEVTRYELHSIVTNDRAAAARRAAILAGGAIVLSTTLVLAVGALHLSGGLRIAALLLGWIAGVVAGLAGFAALLIEHTKRWTRTIVGGAVVVGPDALVLEAEDRRPVHVPRASLHSGYREGRSVHCRLVPASELTLECTSVASAEHLLDEVGLGVGSRAATLELRWRGWYALYAASLSVGLMVFTILHVLERNLLANGFAPHALGMWPMLGLAALGAIVGGAFQRSRVTVGADGVRLHGRRARFYPLADIAAVARDEEDIVLVLRSGERVILGESTRPYLETMRALETRMDDARRRIGRAPPAAHAALDPAGREPAEWAAALKGLAENGRRGAYRGAHVDRDVLGAVVEDGAAPASHRVGAAIALGAHGDSPARETIRIAARATGDDDLRAALELAADGDAERAATRGLKLG